MHLNANTPHVHTCMHTTYYIFMCSAFPNQVDLFCFRPFDETLYEDEVDEDEVMDEEGRARLKLKVGCRHYCQSAVQVHLFNFLSIYSSPFLQQLKTTLFGRAGVGSSSE